MADFESIKRILPFFKRNREAQLIDFCNPAGFYFKDDEHQKNLSALASEYITKPITDTMVYEMNCKLYKLLQNASEADSLLLVINQENLERLNNIFQHSPIIIKEEET